MSRSTLVTLLLGASSIVACGSATAPPPPSAETRSAVVDARTSCDALPLHFGDGRLVGGVRGTRAVHVWDGKACVEAQAPFGLSGIPIECEGQGCQALFDTEDACVAAHAKCATRRP